MRYSGRLLNAPILPTRTNSRLEARVINTPKSSGTSRQCIIEPDPETGKEVAFESMVGESTPTNFIAAIEKLATLF